MFSLLQGYLYFFMHRSKKMYYNVFDDHDHDEKHSLHKKYQFLLGNCRQKLLIISINGDKFLHFYILTQNKVRLQYIEREYQRNYIIARVLRVLIIRHIDCDHECYKVEIQCCYYMFILKLWIPQSMQIGSDFMVFLIVRQPLGILYNYLIFIDKVFP